MGRDMEPMELPPLLRRAIDLVLEGVAPADLSAAAESLSARYRAELRDERFHLADDLAVSAYLATRLPATYAAIRASLKAACENRPGFTPRSLLDVGAGAGAALWAAVDRWPGLEAALLLEGSPVMRAWDGRLSAAAGVGRLRWRAADIATALPDAEPHDLVTLAYVL